MGFGQDGSISQKVIYSTELIPFKQLEDGTLDPSRCRGFAYVNLVPKDDGALGRCLSLYNGCKWRGGILRVEVARPAYQLRMAEEAAAEAQAQAHAAQQREREQEKQQKAEVARAWGAEAAAPDRALHIKPLNILAPTGKKVVSQGKVKRFFPPVKDVPVSRLSWDSPPAPATKDRPGKTYSLGLAAASTAGAVEEQHAAARAAEPAAGKRKGGDTALELRNKLMKIANPLARFDSGSDSPPAAELDPSANTAPGDATDEEELVESSGLSSMEEGNDEDLDMAQAASSASPSASVDSDLTNTSGSDAAAEKSSSEHEEGADAAEDEDHWGTGVQAIEQSSERSEAELSDAAEGSEAELSDAAEGSADSASLRGSGEAVEPADAVAARAPDSSDAQAGASGMLDPELVGLTAGLSFVRPADCTAALAQWHSQREGQMADWKRKRRTALKYITSRKPAAKRKLRYPH
ncbi:hypothetical protein WJX72_005330 [[Myrmecia] bisecta]|uniref:RRM domain-containing protein n=1 Tax=[Myrmecia] bisecta TaxID=41462 RepID=A0AAW1QF16_9CHLO